MNGRIIVLKKPHLCLPLPRSGAPAAALIVHRMWGPCSKRVYLPSQLSRHKGADEKAVGCKSLNTRGSGWRDPGRQRFKR